MVTHVTAFNWKKAPDPRFSKVTKKLKKPKF